MTTPMRRPDGRSCRRGVGWTAGDSDLTGYWPSSSDFAAAPSLADDVARLDRNDQPDSSTRVWGEHRDPDHELALGDTPVRRHPSPCPGGRRFGTEPCGSPAAPGSRSRPSRVSSGASAPKLKVFVCAARLPRGSVRRAADSPPRGSRPAGRDREALLLGADREGPARHGRAAGRPSAGGATRRPWSSFPGRRGPLGGALVRVVKIVIARSGIVSSPVFRTERVRLVFWARRWFVGKSAFVTWTGNSPEGSSWRSRPRPEATPVARSVAIAPTATR